MEKVGTTKPYRFLRHNCGQIAIDAILFAYRARGMRRGMRLERRAKPYDSWDSEINQDAAIRTGGGVGGPGSKLPDPPKQP